MDQMSGHSREQHRFLSVDREVIQMKPIPQLEAVDEVGDLPEVFERVVDADRQSGFPGSQRVLGAFEGIELRAFDVHFDEVDALQPVYARAFVDRVGGNRRVCRSQVGL